MNEGYTILSAAGVAWVPDVIWRREGDLALAFACEQPGHDELTVRLDSLLFFKASLKVLAFRAVTPDAAERAMVFLSDHMQGFCQRVAGEDYLFLVHVRRGTQPLLFRSVIAQKADQSGTDCQFARQELQQLSEGELQWRSGRHLRRERSRCIRRPAQSRRHSLEALPGSPGPGRSN